MQGGHDLCERQNDFALWNEPNQLLVPIHVAGQNASRTEVTAIFASNTEQTKEESQTDHDQGREEDGQNGS